MNNLCKVLLIAISSRLFIIIVSILFTIIFSNQHVNFLNMFVKADSAFYLDIAKNGYPQGVPAPGSIMFTSSGSPVPDIIAYSQGHSFHFIQCQSLWLDLYSLHSCPHSNHS